MLAIATPLYCIRASRFLMLHFSSVYIIYSCAEYLYFCAYLYGYPNLKYILVILSISCMLTSSLIISDWLSACTSVRSPKCQCSRNTGLVHLSCTLLAEKYDRLKLTAWTCTIDRYLHQATTVTMQYTLFIKKHTYVSLLNKLR